ncbi:MAG: hypothetical protein ACJAVK_003214 [Akkermansiaceae bacterium]|jgi:hypothetical protein
MSGKKIPIIVWLIWAALVVSIVGSLWRGYWSAVMISSITLFLTWLPIAYADRFSIKIPTRFATAIVIFIFATLFLGEIKDFYGRFWWWDVILHTGSAVAFGLFGFILIFMLFEGDRFAAPPIAIAFLSFCVAMAIGGIWEIFEFLMDQSLGMNMQKSGLVDTMWDLIVDAIGALFAAVTGFLHLKTPRNSGLGLWIKDFVDKNRSRFRKLDDKMS